MVKSRILLLFAWWLTLIESVDEIIVKTASSPDLFLVRDGVRHKVPDFDTFLSSGYTDTDIKEISNEELAAIPTKCEHQ